MAKAVLAGEGIKDPVSTLSGTWRDRGSRRKSISAGKG